MRSRRSTIFRTILLIALSCAVRPSQATVKPRTEDLVQRAAIIVVGRQISAEVVDSDNIPIVIEPINFLKGWPRKKPNRLIIRLRFFSEIKPWSEKLQIDLQEDMDRDVDTVRVYFLNLIVDDTGNMTLVPIDAWFGVQPDSPELRRQISAAISQTARKEMEPINWQIVLLGAGLAVMFSYVLARLMYARMLVHQPTQAKTDSGL